MMKRKLLSMFPLLATASVAHAHPAIHADGFWGNLAHMLTQPDHLLILAGACVLGYLLIRRLYLRQ